MINPFGTRPRNVDVERAVLAAVLADGLRVADEAIALLTRRSFYEPRHERLWDVIADLRSVGQPADFLTVQLACQRAGDVDLIRLLPELTGGPVTAASLAHHAEQLRALAKLRALADLADRLAQRALNPADDTPDAIAEWAADEARSVRDEGLLFEDIASALTLDELLAEPDHYDWLIPGLLERGDRLLLTGSEGLGKSMVCRQIAVAAAAGLHPFEFTIIDPVKVLAIDLENGRPKTRRVYRQLGAAAVSANRPVPEGKLWIEVHPRGIDVLSPSGLRWLLARVELHMPELLVIGPLYRLFDGNPNDDAEARKVALALDRCRDVAGCALVLECHAPHSDGTDQRPIRPFGSSLWRRWPEFGYGIRYVKWRNEVEAAEIRRERRVELVPWRGPRDERDWPEQLRAGSTWPWVPLPPVDAETATWRAAAADTSAAAPSPAPDPQAALL